MIRSMWCNLLCSECALWHFYTYFFMVPEGKDNTGRLVVLYPLVCSLVNLKVKDHCVRAVFFTSSGVSEMDYALKKTCWLWT